jgi:hypothetical protein
MPAAPLGQAAGFDIEAFVRQQLQQSTGDAHAQTHRQVDRLLFKLALDHTGGNYSEAACERSASTSHTQWRVTPTTTP